MNTFTVLIADDEPNARAYLRRLLLKDEQVDLIKECNNGAEVIRMIERIKPEIIFLDVEMPGATGLEVAGKLSDDIAVIFTTAYERYAVEAFDFEAVDYILKPFDEGRFKRSLQRGKDFILDNRKQDLSRKLLSVLEDYTVEKSSSLKFIELKKNGLIKKVFTADIKYVEADSVYAELHTIKGKELYRSSLNDLEKTLPESFLRIHRAFIINMNMVEKVSYNNNNTYDFILKDSTSLTSGRSYKDSIVERL
jgi:two-component system LytT family response regulator